MSQCAFARTVGSHDRVHFAGADMKIDAAQNFLVADFGREIFDLQHSLSLSSTELNRFLHRRFEQARSSSPGDRRYRRWITPARKLASTACASSQTDFCEHTEQKEQ